jgi:DNA-binding SARP family transcriptional activator
MPVGLDVRILGPLDVQLDGRSLALGGPQQRAVLAILALNAGQVVSTARLIDELWGEQPPGSAKPVLQGYVSNLRKAIGSVLVTRAPGYALELEPGQLDLGRFEHLLGEGQQARAAGRLEAAAVKLREALGLWRGPALAEFAYEQFAQAAIVRLDELRLTALEERIEVDLGLGRHAQVVGELEGLVAQHPLRERSRGQLMLALYRSGRQAEALDVYQQARRALVEELGIDPTPALQALERAILQQDPVLDLAKDEEVRPEPAAGPSLEVPERSILVARLGGGDLDHLLALAGPLARRPPREIILAELVPAPGILSDATRAVRERRAALAAGGIAARGAAFVSESPGEDVVRLASEQNVDLALLDTPPGEIVEGVPSGDVGAVLEHAPCDVGVLVTRSATMSAPGPDRAVLVPFGGADHDWTAAEIGAWLAGVLVAPLRLLGTTSDPATGRRDASRLLANASLVLQDVTGIDTEPVLVDPGEDAVIEAADEAGLLVVGLSVRWRQEGIGATRLAVATKARPPTLLVRRGLRPGGLAPRESLTRFTWTLGR